MTSYQPVAGIFSSSIKLHKPCLKTRIKKPNEPSLLQTFQDDYLYLLAPLILKRQDLVIAANPANENDHLAINQFAHTWENSRDHGLALIKKQTLTCILLIYTAKTLILFRDRLGIDNIYYRKNTKEMFFSSDLSTLIDNNDVLDIHSALNYLLYGKPRADNSLYQRIKSLPAAHFIKADSSELACRRYWSPRDKPMPLCSREERLSLLEASLESACHKNLSKQNNAIFLSGGLDSSYIAYIASQQHRDRTHCYTISYQDKQYEDESYYAKVVSDHFGLPLKEIELSTEQILAYLMLLLDDPQPSSAWAAICNNALIDAAVADGHKHILSGLGSDEVFGNYDKIVDYYFRVRESIQRGNTGKIDLLDHVTAIDQLMFPGVADFFTREDLQSILSDKINTDFALNDLREFYQGCGLINEDTHLFSFIVSHECHHRIPDLLLRNFNRHAQHQGAHIVYPFLEADFVEHACCLYPQERLSYQNNKWQNKISLKSILADKLPYEILKRKRGTFNFPFQLWLKHDQFYALVKDTLEYSPIWNLGLFKKNTLKQYLDYMHRNKRNKPIKNKRWVNELWVLLTLSGWYKRYLS